MSSKDEEMLHGSLLNVKTMYSFLRQMEPHRTILNALEAEPDRWPQIGRKDRKDTLISDAYAELLLSTGSPDNGGMQGHFALMQQVYDTPGVFICEERGKIGNANLLSSHTPVMISDPIDNSKRIVQLVENMSRDYDTLGELFDATRDEWGPLALVQAPNTSVTFYREGEIKYTIILNLITAEVLVGCEVGVFREDITGIEKVDDLKNPVRWRTDYHIEDLASELHTVVTYVASEKYQRNFVGTYMNSLFQPAERFEGPVGPLRIAFLIDDAAEIDQRVGAIFYNGEKCQESGPAIAMAYFSRRAVCGWKLFCDREYTERRRDRPLTPNEQNSMYRGWIEHKGVNLGHLQDRGHPSEVRDSILLVPHSNIAAYITARGLEATRRATRLL